MVCVAKHTKVARVGRRPTRTPNPGPVGVSIKRLREMRGWSQGTLAEAAGVSRSTVALLESGERQDTSLFTIQALAKAFDVAQEDLTRPVSSGALKPWIDQFAQSAWFVAMQVTDEELAWLNTINQDVLWGGSDPTPETVGDLVKVRRKARAGLL